MLLTVLGSESVIIDRKIETSAILLQNVVVTCLALWGQDAGHSSPHDVQWTDGYAIFLLQFI
jgi:hypothetical protein